MQFQGSTLIKADPNWGQSAVRRGPPRAAAAGPAVKLIPAPFFCAGRADAENGADAVALARAAADSVT